MSRDTEERMNEEKAKPDPELGISPQILPFVVLRANVVSDIIGLSAERPIHISQVGISRGSTIGEKLIVRDGPSSLPHLRLTNPN